MRYSDNDSASVCHVWAKQESPRLLSRTDCSGTCRGGCNNVLRDYVCLRWALMSFCLSLSPTFFIIIGTADQLKSILHFTEVRTQYCAALNAWRLSYLFWIPLIISEIVLFALSLYKGYQCYFKDNEGKWGGYSGIRCMDVLIRDSILYFFAWVVSYILTSVSYMWLPR